MTLTYVGRSANSDTSLAYKKLVDDTWATVKVDSSYVSASAAAAATDLKDQTYIDTQDALRAQKTAVDAADANYVPTTQRGAAGGVASLGSDVYVPSGQLGTVQTDRVATIVAGTISLSGTHTVTTSTVKEFQAGSLSISDPGFPYTVMVFGVVRGNSNLAGQPANRNTGTGMYGQAQVLGPSDEKMGIAICTPSWYDGFYPILPYASLNATPLQRTGAMTLALWLSCWSGTTYTFNSTGMSLWALVAPAL